MSLTLYRVDFMDGKGNITEGKFMTLAPLPDESEQSLIDFARERGMIAMRHPKSGQLYAFDASTAPEWAPGQINLAFLTPRDDEGNIVPSRENPFGENVDGRALFVP